MKVHQQHYSFQTVYKKIKSQSNNTCVCSDTTKQIKQMRALQSPCSVMVTETDRLRASRRTWQRTFENEKKKNSSLETFPKLNNIYNRGANFGQLIYCKLITHKNKQVSILC